MGLVPKNILQCDPVIKQIVNLPFLEGSLAAFSCSDSAAVASLKPLTKYIKQSLLLKGDFYLSI